MSEHDPEGKDFDEVAAELAQDAKESFEANQEEQHELLEAAAEEDGAPLLETKCEIYGHIIPVSGRLTGELIERVESLDSEAKRRAEDDVEGESSVSDIVMELADILGGLIDDPELTTDTLYQQYRKEGVGPIRTIAEEVMDSLRREDERVRGQADGFRSK